MAKSPAKFFARARRFVFAMAWTFEAVCKISRTKVAALIIAGIVARLAIMSAFILAIGTINLVISRQHRLELFERHGLSWMPELAFVIGLTALVAGLFLLSVTLGLWRSQSAETLTDMLAKSFQKQLYQRFRDESRHLTSRPDYFTGLYAAYNRSLDRQLPIALKASSGHVIDLTMNLVTLTITLSFLLIADSFALTIVVATICLASLIYILASRRHRMNVAAVRQQRTQTTRERLIELRKSPLEDRTAEFWDKLDAEHEQEFSSHLETISPANRIYTGRGWSLARILSSPAILNPLSSAIIFAALILYFFQRSQIETVELHYAIIVLFLARFSIIFGNAVSMEMRKFGERYATIVLCRDIISGRSTVLENLSTSIKDIPETESESENEVF